MTAEAPPLSGMTVPELIAQADDFIEHLKAMRRRAEAAQRSEPLPDGRRDPDLEPPKRFCSECGNETEAELAVIGGRTMCRDRVDCWQRFTGRKRGGR